MKKLLPIALFALFACTASPALANGPSEKSTVIPVISENTLSKEQLKTLHTISENETATAPADNKHGLKKMIRAHKAEDVHGGGYFYISGAGLILLIILLIILL